MIRSRCKIETPTAKTATAAAATASSISYGNTTATDTVSTVSDTADVQHPLGMCTNNGGYETREENRRRGRENPNSPRSCKKCFKKSESLAASGVGDERTRKQTRKETRQAYGLQVSGRYKREQVEIQVSTSGDIYQLFVSVCLRVTRTRCALWL